jgi:hypothetical protein
MSFIFAVIMVDPWPAVLANPSAVMVATLTSEDDRSLAPSDPRWSHMKMADGLLVFVFVGFDQLRHFGVGADRLDEQNVA